MTAYRTVVLDVDSTVSAIEGIDWLASRRDAVVAETVAALTTAAMEAKVPIDEVYGRRLEIIRPTRDEIRELPTSTSPPHSPVPARPFARGAPTASRSSW